MSFEVKKFYFNRARVRLIKDDNGSWWWLFRDVCCALGHKSGHTAANIGEDNSMLFKMRMSKQQRKVKFINETGLLNLLERTRNKYVAQAFLQWAVDDVLPKLEEKKIKPPPNKADQPQNAQQNALILNPTPPPPVMIQCIGSEDVSTVDARKLHQFLESKQEFSAWIKARIEKYDFKENQDFIIFDNLIKNSGVGRPSSQYALTLNMAKELSMVEQTDRGRKARKYFIECERKLKTGTVISAPEPKVPLTYTQALRAALQLAEKVECQENRLDVLATENRDLMRQHTNDLDEYWDLQKQLWEQKPKVEFVNQLEAQGTVITIQNFCIIEEISVSWFVQMLLDKNYVYRTLSPKGHAGKIQPYKRYTKPSKKYFGLDWIEDAKGKLHLRIQLTVIGMAHFHELCNQEKKSTSHITQNINKADWLDIPFIPPTRKPWARK